MSDDREIAKKYKSEYKALPMLGLQKTYYEGMQKGRGLERKRILSLLDGLPEREVVDDCVDGADVVRLVFDVSADELRSLIEEKKENG